MQVEVSKTDDYFQVRIPIKESYNDKYIRKFLDYIKIKNNASKSRATDDDIDNLSEELMDQWWTNNRDRFKK